MKKASLLVFLLSLSACSSLPKPGPAKKATPVLERGWNYVESEHDFLNLESGTDPVSFSAPVLSGEKLIFGSERFGLVALLKRNGQTLWQSKLDGPVRAQPLATENAVYAGTLTGSLYAFDPNGRQLWRASLGSPVQGSFLLSFQRLYVGTADDALHALDPATGKELWVYRRPAFGGTSVTGGGNPAAVNGKVWMGFSDGSLLALNPETGGVEMEKQFRDSLKFSDIDARVVGWRDGLLVSTYDGKLRFLRKDGSTVWEFRAGGARAPIVGDGEVIYFPSSDGAIYALSGNTGKEIWSHGLRRGIPSGLSLVTINQRKVLLVAGSEEKVLVLDAANGALLGRSNLGRGSGSYGSIATDAENKKFYVLSHFSRVHEFRLNL